jgi:hypothetical protein
MAYKFDMIIRPRTYFLSLYNSHQNTLAFSGDIYHSSSPCLIGILILKSNIKEVVGD